MVFLQNLLEKAYFTAKMSGSAMVWPASSDFWKALLDWYSYVSLFPDLLCNIGLSISGLRKIRFYAYTPRRISTQKNQFANTPGFPLSAFIILD